MGSPYSSQYGAYQYQSPEQRALTGITPDSYDYRDQSKLISKLTNDVSYMAQYMGKMQNGIDKANENFIQQIQDFINEIIVTFSGQGDTGFDFGDLKYIFQAIGALFGWDVDPATGLTLPLNLDDAAWNFMSQYVLSTQAWQDESNQLFDQSIATMVDVMGEVPILGQATVQLASMLSQMRDQSNTLTYLLNQFTAAFNITPANPVLSSGDYFVALNNLYEGLTQLFGTTDFGSFQPIFDQISRWDQQVIDAIVQLSEGDLSGLIGLIPISQLTNVQPDLQNQSDFTDIDSIAAASGGDWSRDPAVGRTALGSATVTADGHIHALTGTNVTTVGGDTLNLSVWVKWSGLTATGSPIQLVLRCSNGLDYVLQSIVSPGASSTTYSGQVSGWVNLQGSKVIPSGVTWGKQRLLVNTSATAGQIWFDDAPETKVGTLIPQEWIDGLDDIWNTVLGWFGIGSQSGAIGTSQTDFWTNLYNEVLADLNIFGDYDVQTQINTAIDQIGQIFNAQIVTPINTAVSQVSTWWNQITGQTQHLTSGGALPGSAITGTVAAGNLQNNAWLNRLINNATILFDVFHLTYTSTQWNSAWTDLMALVGIANGTSAPSNPTPTIGPAITANANNHQSLVDAVNMGITNTSQTGAATADVQAATSGLSSSVSSLQAQVAEFSQTNDGVGGFKVTSAANGGSTDWGSKWTLAGNGTVKTDLGAFAWDQQSSGQTIDKNMDGYYNGGQTLTDDQVISMSFIGAVQSFNGGDGPYNGITARRDSTGTNYIYVRAFYNSITIGYCVSGAEHNWLTVAGVKVPATGLLTLKCTGRLFEVQVNGVTIPGLSKNDSTNVSAKGSSFRNGGQQMMAKHGVFGEQYGPAEIRQWQMSDQAAATAAYGTSGRWKRISTTGVTKNRGVVAPITTDVFDTTDYVSSDLALTAGGIAFWTAGLYRISYAVRFAAALNTSMAASIIHNTTSGVVNFCENENVDSTMFGLGGSFVVTAIGDGGATEVWYPGLDITGSGTYNIIGDGAGIATWLTVERIA